MDPQEQRAIRRAFESAALMKRPADWTEADYRNFTDALEENHYTLEPMPDKKKRLAAAATEAV